MKEILQKYRFALLMAAAVALLTAVRPATGVKAVEITLANFKEMLTFLPPIFILTGLLDVWVPKETLVKFMGHGSGWKGLLVAFVLGTAAAGPLYAAFPLAAVLMKKGARFAYVIFLLGVWSSTKLPLVLFETASLGVKFTLIHVAVGLTGFLLASYLVEKMVPGEEKEEIYQRAALWEKA